MAKLSGSHAKIAGSLKCTERWQVLLTNMFFFCTNDFARNSGIISFIARKKILVKNVKKHRKYFQIEEDGLIFCLRDANKRRFAEQRITKRRKVGNVNFQRQNLELIQNDHGNFQLQNLREVIQTTMEISKVNISVQLIENDDGIFRRQNFG